MSKNDFAMTETAFAASEVGNTFLRHALKVWAREQGVAEDHLPRLIGELVEYAQTSVRDVRPMARA